MANTLQGYEGNDDGALFTNRRNKRRIMKRRIKHNDLTAWFLEDHATLPASYLKSCQEFFDEISKRQASSDKPQATSDKLPHIQTIK
jgi:hypothetical protein